SFGRCRKRTVISRSIADLYYGLAGIGADDVPELFEVGMFFCRDWRELPMGTAAVQIRSSEPDVRAGTRAWRGDAAFRGTNVCRGAGASKPQGEAASLA